MKWKEMSLFYRIVYVTGCLLALIYMIVVVCSLTGLIPRVYDIPWAPAIYGAAALCIGLQRIKHYRSSAICMFVVAAVAFILAIVRWLQ